MWECPCISCMDLIFFFFFFGVRASFSIAICHLFPLFMMAIISLIGGMTADVVPKVCTIY